MEIITHVLEEKRNGEKLVKNFFLYENEGNILSRANSYFIKHEKKIAKLNHKSKNK